MNVYQNKIKINLITKHIKVYPAAIERPFQKKKKK